MSEMATNPLEQKEFQFKQRTRSLFKFQEAYEVTNPETKEGYFFAKRDRLWFKKDAHLFFGTNDHGEKALTMVDESFFDSFGSFGMVDPDGNLLARFRRKFWRSWFWRETWIVENAEGQQIGTLESKGGFFKTFIRKFALLSIIPVIGPILSAFMRLHFQFMNERGEVYAEFSRKFSIRDFYKLEFLNEDAMNVDKMAVIGISVLLDAAESR